MARTLLHLAKVGLPLGLLAYFVWAFVDPGTFFALAEKTAVLPIIACFASLLAGRWLQAVQIRIALSAGGIDAGVAEIFRAQLIATFYTMFLPGDVVGGGITWYLLKRLRGGGAMIATILVYVRLVFLVSAIPFVVFGLLIEERLHSAPVLVALTMVSAATILVALPLISRSAAAAAGRLLSSTSAKFGKHSAWMQRILKLLQDCVTTCASASVRSVAAVFTLAIVLHLIGAAGFWFAAEASHANVPIHAFLWLWPLMLVVHMLPISLGGLGVRELTLIYVLNALFATSAESVLLISMIGLLATTLFSLAGGIWSAVLATRPEGEGG